MFDSQTPVHLKKAATSSREKLAGIISTAPAIIFEGPEIKVMGGVYEWAKTSKAPLALAGRVPVKVVLDNGVIKTGDPITVSSSTPGVGVKAVRSGRIVGHALEDLLEATTTPGAVDQIMVLVENGYWNNPDEVSPSLLVAVIDAVREWLETAVITIKEIIVDRIISREITTDKLCVGSTCVTEAELQALLNGQQDSSSTEPESTDAIGIDNNSDTELPTITLNGNNPVEIEINSVYSDMGASVTDNVNDNLGYKVSLDSGPEIYPGELVLDTSTAAEHTITYIAVDQAGNTGTAQRKVVVYDPSIPTKSSEESVLLEEPTATTTDPVSEPISESEPTPEPTSEPQLTEEPIIELTPEPIATTTESSTVTTTQTQ